MNIKTKSNNQLIIKSHSQSENSIKRSIQAPKLSVSRFERWPIQLLPSQFDVFRDIYSREQNFLQSKNTRDDDAETTCQNSNNPIGVTPSVIHPLPIPNSGITALTQPSFNRQFTSTQALNALIDVFTDETSGKNQHEKRSITFNLNRLITNVDANLLCLLCT